MAVVTDPDLLAQGEEVIYNTISQTISVYPVGANVTQDTNVANGTATLTVANNTVTIPGTGWDFTSATNNDIVTIYNTHDAGHYRISSISIDGLAATLLNIDDSTPSWNTPTSNNQVALRVYLDGSNGTGEGDLDEGTGGNGLGVAKDGITVQAQYSFTKDEWNSDTFNSDNTKVWPLDDLIRHPFPWEPITSEQFELGGGLAHDGWGMFNDYTIKKMRTGGWADKNNTSTNDFQRYTGIVTLGSLDGDARVYYQQSNATATPVDFDFLSVVNEPIRFFLDTDQNGTADTGEDKRTYLKLFVRKKARTYAGSEIADIGVSTIQTIVNRFPLTHATDTAITNRDADVIGITPFHSAEIYDQSSGAGLAQAAANTNVDISAGGFTVTKAGADFAAGGLVANDTIDLAGAGGDSNTYTVNSVSTTTFTVRGDADFSGFKATSSTGDLAFYSRYVNVNKGAGVGVPFATGGTSNGIVDSTGTTGTIRDDFNGAFGNTAIGDFLVIRDSTGTTENHRGVYKIMTVTNTVHCVVNTTDQVFPTTLSNVSYYVSHPGCYLQYKKDIKFASNGQTWIRFTSSNNTIETSQLVGSVVPGATITVSNTASNDGTYTVLTAAVSQNSWSLVTTDSLTDENVTAGFELSEGFLRTISGVVYGFNWRLFGNGNSLANCYQFVQHQLRQPDEIDWGPFGVADGHPDRGDITDLLMTYAAPTGTALNLFIDDLDSNDINNTTYQDASGANRNFPFTASGTLNFNDNLQNDTNAKYWLFFQSNFGTASALVVNDFDGNAIQGNVGGSPSISFTFDYDNNTQGGRSAGTDAPVYLVCIGLNGAQYVIQSGTLTRATGQAITAVAALERNYLPGSV